MRSTSITYGRHHATKLGTWKYVYFAFDSCFLHLTVVSVHSEHSSSPAAPLEEWSIQERLCLASSVVRSGDQNWCVSHQNIYFSDETTTQIRTTSRNHVTCIVLLLNTIGSHIYRKNGYIVIQPSWRLGLHFDANCEREYMNNVWTFNWLFPIPKILTWTMRVKCRNRLQDVTLSTIVS